MVLTPSALPRTTSCPPASTPAVLLNPAKGTLDPVMARALSMARKMLAKHGAQDWVLCLAGPRYGHCAQQLMAQMHPESKAEWEPLPQTGAVSTISIRQDGVGLRSQLYATPFGMLFYADPAFAVISIPLRVEAERGNGSSFEICAAPTGEQVARMLERFDRENERGRVAGVAPVIRQIGENAVDLERTVLEGGKPLLAEKTEVAVAHEIRDFFAPQWRELADKNRIPYRRGVLLFGPPGNGKTSAVRACLNAMPQVAAVFCRPTSTQDVGQTLENAVSTWRKLAPAVLVIEDIDSLFTDYPVSAFLNMLDGVVPMKENGLLLIATTNNPEALDPALNNRPGRFDVAIRFGAPDAKLRQAYFTRELDAAESAAMDDGAWKKLLKETQRLSFAHLNEIVIRAGFQAARDLRVGRTAEDLLEAARMVNKGALEADGGFREEGSGFGFGGKEE